MLPGVRDDARRAVAALLVAIAGVAAAFASVAAASHRGWLIACIVIAIAAAALAVAVELPDVKALVGGRLRLPQLWRSRALAPALAPAVPAVPLPVPVITDAWQYTTDGNYARAAMMAMDTTRPGSGSDCSLDRPPWIRFVVMIACNQIGSDADPSRMWSNFVRFLKDQPVTSLVNS